MRFPLARCVERASVVAIDRRDLLAEAEDDSEVAQVVLQALDDLRVAEVEQPGPLLDDRHLHAERREHGRVLDADHAGPDDHARRRYAVDAAETVGVEDGAAVELDRGRAGGTCPDGDDDPLGGQPPLFLARCDRDGVRIDEARAPGDDLDVVSQQLVAHDLDLAVHHLLRPQAEIVDRDLLLDAVARPVRRPMGHARQVDDRLAKSLRGDRAPVDGDAAQLAALDDGDLVTELRCLDRRLLPGGPGPDDEELVVVAHRFRLTMTHRRYTTTSRRRAVRSRTVAR